MTQAIELSGSKIYLSQLATIQQARGDDQNALITFNRDIELYPQLAYAFTNRGRFHLDRHELDAAIADFTKAIELKMTDERPFRWRGEAYKAKGDELLAKADWYRAIEIASEDFPIARKNGAASGEALENFGIVAELNEMLGDRGAADAAYRDMLALTSFSWRATDKRWRAWAFYKLGQNERAADEIALVLRIWPNDAEALNTRGHINEALGRKDEAAADYQLAAKSDCLKGFHLER